MKLRRKGRAGFGTGTGDATAAVGSFLCFRPAASSDHHVKPLTSAGSSSQDPATPHCCSRTRHALAKVFRSASFIATLERLGRARKHRSRSLAWKESDDASEESSALASSSGSTYGGEYRRTRSASFSSFSSSVSMTSTTPYLPEQEACPPRRQTATKWSAPEKPPPCPTERQNDDGVTGVLLLLIGLCVMVVFGRLSAILWTAVCVFFAPRRKPAVGPPPKELPELRRSACEKGDYKKHTFSDVPLERNRRAGIYAQK